MDRLRSRLAEDGAFRASLILSLVASVFLLSAGSTRLAGDRAQVALPALALGCEVVNGRAAEYLARFAVLEAGIHLPKTLLGEAPLALRPDGGDAGMPSGHTAAAVFGAATLADRCLLSSPAARGAVLLAAAFVGGSRVEAGKHTLWQVMAGALLGWGVQRAGRRGLSRLLGFIRPRPRAAY